MKKSESNTQQLYNTEVAVWMFENLKEAEGWANQTMRGKNVLSLQVKPFQVAEALRGNVAKFLVTIIYKVPLDSGVKKD